MAKDNDVLVIGAGLGGLSAAISLASAGKRVKVYEKNERIGGKLNLHIQNGFTFDLGPSILTLPWVIGELFSRSGRNPADYLQMIPLDPQWRNFFPDGTTLDLFHNPDRMRQELDRFDPAEVEPFFRFLEYSARQYDFVDKGYFRHGLDTVRDFMRFYSLRDVFGFDLVRSMHGGVTRFIRNPQIIDVLDYFIKYVGSSAYAAPGFMNLLPTIQTRYQLWYTPGGLYQIARALRKLLDELEVEVVLNCEVTRIIKNGLKVTGVETADGSRDEADYVVCNMETIPAYEKLLSESRAFMLPLRRFEPSCSGLVIELGVSRKYPQLAHHNFFFSKDQRSHFRSVFRDKKLPDDPTIYLVAASRTDPSVAPEGMEGLKILPHIPHLNDRHRYSRSDYLSYKDKVLDKLERMGLEGLRESIVVEHVLTPDDIRKMYYSNRGSIYGVACDRWKNFALKTPKQSSRYRNLFFVGGSVNPGSGVPMVLLCGQRVCDRILALEAEKG